MSRKQTLSGAFVLAVAACPLHAEPVFVAPTLLDGRRVGAQALNGDGSAAFVTYDHDRFCWSPTSGTLQIYDVGPGLTTPHVLSDDGEVVAGTFHMDGPQFPDTSEFCFIWSEATGTRIVSPAGQPNMYTSDLSGDGSTVVGSSGCCHSNTAFRIRWQEEPVVVDTLPHLPGQSNSGAAAANIDGSIVVGSSGGRPVMWSPDGFISEFGLPAGRAEGYAIDVSDDGSVVLVDADGAYVWTEAGGHVELPPLPTGTVTDPLMMSNDGRVVLGECWDAAAQVWVDVVWWDAEPAVSLRDFLVASGADIAPNATVRSRGMSGDATAMIVDIQPTIGLPGHFIVSGLPTPVAAPCPCDFDNSQVQDLNDYFAFLGDFFAQLDVGNPQPGSADFDGSGFVDLNDYFAFLGCLGDLAAQTPCP